MAIPPPFSRPSTRSSSSRHHVKRSSNVSMLIMSDPTSGQKYMRRRDVYFRVNQYMRENRLSVASTFLRDKLKFVSNDADHSSEIDWSVLQGPTRNNIDINYITDAVKQKQLQDIMGDSKVCWMDIAYLECKLSLFYFRSHDGHSGRDYDVDRDTNCNEVADREQTSRDCMAQLHRILHALQTAKERTPTLLLQSYYCRFMECQSRAFMAYALVHSERVGFAKFAGLALSHCRAAMKLDAFHSFSHAVYGYLLDRCLDRYEEARQFLEYAIHLNNFYDRDSAAIDGDDDDSKQQQGQTPDHGWHRFALIHVWLACLLSNFEEEFREIEFRVDLEIREEMEQRLVSPLGTSGSVTPRAGVGVAVAVAAETAALHMQDQELPTVMKSHSYTPGRLGVAATLRAQSSMFMVKQLSHMQSMERQRVRLRANTDRGDGTGRLSFSMSGTGTATGGPGGPGVITREYTDFDEHDVPDADALARLPLADQASNGLHLDELIQERLNDDTLTQQIGSRFGVEFEKTMRPIADKPDAHFLLALQLEAQNSRIHSMYGIFLLQQEKLDAAKAHFEKAIKYDPHSVVSLNNLGWILSCTQYSQYQAAKNYLLSAAQLAPANASVHFNLARLFAHAFGDEEVDNAKRYYLAALMHDGTNAHIHFFYALFLRFIAVNGDTSSSAKNEAFTDAKQHVQKSDALLAQHASGEDEDGMFAVQSYIEHAKILKHESKFRAAMFLLKRATKLDIARKREIQDLLKQIQTAENEANKLNRASLASKNSSRKSRKASASNRM